MLALPMVVVIQFGGSTVSIRPRANRKFRESKEINDGGADGDNAFL